jgi:hypothetical protein
MKLVQILLLPSLVVGRSLRGLFSNHFVNNANSINRRLAMGDMQSLAAISANVMGGGGGMSKATGTSTSSSGQNMMMTPVTTPVAAPVIAPVAAPVAAPVFAPFAPIALPPIVSPVTAPTPFPTGLPPTPFPTGTGPILLPTAFPTAAAPTAFPTGVPPVVAPVVAPATAPIVKTRMPVSFPTKEPSPPPSEAPIIGTKEPTQAPIPFPTIDPSSSPSGKPVAATAEPTNDPDTITSNPNPLMNPFPTSAPSPSPSHSATTKPTSAPTSAVLARRLADVTIFTSGSTYNVSDFIPFFKEYAVGAFNNTPGFIGMDITDASRVDLLANSRSTATQSFTLHVVLYLNAVAAADADLNYAALVSGWDFIAVDQFALAAVITAMNAFNGGNATLADVYVSVASPTLPPVTMAPTVSTPLTGRFSDVIISTSGSTYDPNLFIPLFKDYVVSQFNFTPGFLDLAVAVVSSTNPVNGTTSQILILAGTIYLDPVPAADAKVVIADLKSSWNFIATYQQALVGLLNIMSAQTGGTTMLAGATIAGSSTIAPTTFPTTVPPAVTPAPVTKAPTASPVTAPPTAAPTAAPVTKAPTAAPVSRAPTSSMPSDSPTKGPSPRPSKRPTTSAPSFTDQPSTVPSSLPSSVVSMSPSAAPS